MVRYDSFKDSGVEWLGDIPSHWDKIKLKYKGDVIIGLSYKPDDVVNENEGTLVMRSSNIQNGKPNFDDNIYVKTEISDKLTTKEGDILICSRNGSRRLIGKNCLITKDIEGMTWGVFMTMYRSPYSKYMYWLLNSPIFKSQSGLFLTSTINQLTVSTLENMVLPFTENVDEQKQIVSFLDTKTSLIDSLIEKTEQKIELLKEKRTSLINEVVTKGLNPNVEMKDSGVEWIGEIPIHWWVSKLGFLSKPIQGIQVDVENQLYNQHEGSERFIRISDYTMEEEPRYVDSYPESSIVNEEDLVMVRYGSKSGKVYSGIKGVICNNVFRIEHNEKLYTKFLSYFLNQESFYNQIEMSRDNNTLPQVSHGLYKEMKITVPVIQEQQQIVSYLDEQTKLIDNTISIEEKRIELLKEYRQSLISEVVTGKRKVV